MHFGSSTLGLCFVCSIGLGAVIIATTACSPVGSSVDAGPGSESLADASSDTEAPESAPWDAAVGDASTETGRVADSSDAADADASIGANADASEGQSSDEAGDGGAASSGDSAAAAIDAALSPTDAATDGPLWVEASTGGAGGALIADGGPSLLTYFCGSTAIGAAPDGGTDGGTSTLLSTLGSQGSNISGLWKDGDYAAMTDPVGSVVWNVVTGLETVETSGTGLGLANGVFASGNPTTGQIQVVSVADGSTVGSFSVGPYNSAGFATDGSYVWASSLYTLTVWSINGTMLTSLSGTYSDLMVFAGPGQLQLVEDVYEAPAMMTLPTDGGGPTTGTVYDGLFAGWFADGSKFLTTGSDGIRVYDASVTLLDLVPVTTLGIVGGAGSYFWNNLSAAGYPTYPVAIYQLGAGMQPVKTYETGYQYAVGASAHRVALSAYGLSSIIVLDVDGSSLTEQTFPTPYPDLGFFAGDSNGSWIVGNNFGSLYYQGTASAPLQTGTLGCGQVLGMAGSLEGTVAVGTAGAGIITIDLTSGTSWQVPVVAGSRPEQWPEPPGPENDGIALSSDGRTLAATASPYSTRPDRSLSIFQGPSWTLARTSPYVDNAFDNYGFAFDMSLDGSTLAQELTTDPTQGGPDTGQVWVTDITGQLPIWSVTNSKFVPRLSPTGAHSALGGGANSTTTLYTGGTIVASVPGGTAVGWLDDNRVLVQTLPFPDGPSSYIYDANGNLLATPALPGISAFDVVGPSTIFSHDSLTIYDVDTGAVVESFPGTWGVIAGPFVVSVVGRALEATRY